MAGCKRPGGLLSGTYYVNGKGGYRFLAAVQDGSRSTTDRKGRIRIRIWSISSGQVIYDTQPGSSLDALPTLLLGGGAIAIRK